MKLIEKRIITKKFNDSGVEIYRAFALYEEETKILWWTKRTPHVFWLKNSGSIRDSSQDYLEDWGGGDGFPQSLCSKEEVMGRLNKCIEAKDVKDNKLWTITSEIF